MTCILTHSGKLFNFKAPNLHKYDIREIAHALSNLGRFTGHTSRFYSVAQHSVAVSYIVPERLALAALMHDASEAYLGDVASPLKALLPEYKYIEEQTECAIARAFAIRNLYPLHPDIKWADMVALRHEREAYLAEAKDDLDWPALIPIPANAEATILATYTPAFAKEVFLRRYDALLEGGTEP